MRFVVVQTVSQSEFAVGWLAEVTENAGVGKKDAVCNGNEGG